MRVGFRDGTCTKFSSYVGHITRNTPFPSPTSTVYKTLHFPIYDLTHKQEPKTEKMKILALISLSFFSILGASAAQQNISSLISKAMFEQMLKHRNDAACPGKGFYTYEAFIAAAKAFDGFGTTGDDATKKREIAAFLAQTSHETTGGWATASDGPYAWGYCFVSERNNPPDYCNANQQYPCAPGKKYYGRGPIQISYNYNYGPAGRAIGSDLLNNPDLVATDPTISFKTALWFWLSPQSPKPSSHDVITSRWTPSAADSSAGRVPGYGVITNIINGGIECGKGSNAQQQDRIGFYKRYSDILGVPYGNNIDCNNQRSFSDMGNNQQYYNQQYLLLQCDY